MNRYFLMALRDLRAFAPTDGAGAGGDTGAGGGDAGAGAAGTGDAGAGAAAAAWHEDARFDEGMRGYLSAKGVTASADPLDALTKLVGIGQAADKRFGKPLDSVIDKPAEGQSVAEWRRANAAAFGLPDNPDGYEIARPEGLSDTIAWSDGLEGKFRQLAHDRGWGQEDVAAATEMYATYVQDISDSLDRDIAQAEEQLSTELQSLWGADYKVKTTRARQAASALAEAAGLDQDGIRSVSALLNSGDGGNTAALRMFEALSRAMGDDVAAGLGKGAAQLGMAPAEAQAAFNTFTAPDGEWAKASAAGDSATIDRLRPEFNRLAKLAAGKG